MSAGLFGVAFLPAFRWVLYAGVLCLVVSLVLTAVGLLRNRSGRTGELGATMGMNQSR
jgi:hypothetical protein